MKSSSTSYPHTNAVGDQNFYTHSEDADRVYILSSLSALRTCYALSQHPVFVANDASGYYVYRQQRPALHL